MSKCKINDSKKIMLQICNRKLCIDKQFPKVYFIIIIGTQTRRVLTKIKLTGIDAKGETLSGKETV